MKKILYSVLTALLIVSSLPFSLTAEETVVEEVKEETIVEEVETNQEEEITPVIEVIDQEEEDHPAGEVTEIVEDIKEGEEIVEEIPEEVGEVEETPTEPTEVPVEPAETPSEDTPTTNEVFNLIEKTILKEEKEEEKINPFKTASLLTMMPLGAGKEDQLGAVQYSTASYNSGKNTINISFINCSVTGKTGSTGNNGTAIITVTLDKDYTLDDDCVEVSELKNKNVAADKDFGVYKITVTLGKNTDGTITITPKTTATTYDITFDANGGSWNTTPHTVTTGTDGKLTTIPGAPDNAPEGKTFAGWYSLSEGGDEIKTTTVFTENKTVYAHWTDNAPEKQITLLSSCDSKKGSVEFGKTTVDLNEESTITITPKSNYGVESVTVDGGDVNGTVSGSGNSWTYTAPASGSLTSATIVVTFKQVSVTLTYYANNGNDDAKHEVEVLMEDVSEDYVLLADNSVTNFVKENSVFIGWGIAEDSTQTSEKINLNIRKSVYAIWAPACTVTYYENGSDPNKKVEVNNVPEIENYLLLETKESTSFDYNGYYFVGWGLSADSSEPVTSINTKNNKEVYAIWQDKKEYTADFYSVTKLAGTGVDLIEGALPDYSVAKITAPKANDPIIVNLDFSKINSDFNLFDKNGNFIGQIKQIKDNGQTSNILPIKDNDGKKYIEVAKSMLVGKDSNHILLFLDLTGDYMIKYFDTEGKEITKLRTIVDKTEIQSVNLASAEEVDKYLVRDGFDFDGWYESNEYTGEKVTTTSFSEKGEKHFYIKWKPIQSEVEGNIEPIPVVVPDDDPVKGTITTTNIARPLVEEMENILNATNNEKLKEEYSILGETIDIWLEVKKTNEESEEAIALKSFVDKVGAKEHVFFDAELFVGHYDGTEEYKEKITDPKCNILVTVTMPAEVVEKIYKPNENKEYWLYRSHKDEITQQNSYDQIKVQKIVKSLDGKTYDISFYSNKFSTFVLYAVDKTTTPDSPPSRYVPNTATK